ncbi:MAG: DUF4843 domain-containing protein [Odoribacteraceae bacterium]|jgi:hypothetical protein|nr:DUF4843 domain-containing protein [Odoribacteraceae bacterium]
MKKIIITCIALALFACAEENLKLYDGGEAIYFQVLEVNTARILDTVEFGFGPTSYTDYALEIPVKTTGDVMDIDRWLKVKVEKTVNARQGRDFDVESEFVFPAGSPDSRVIVKLYRGPEDDDTTRFVTLRLEPNEFFTINLPYRYRTTSDSVDVRQMTIQFTSSMPKPRYYMDVMMGYFSVDKLLLVNELCNMTYDKWNAPVGAMVMMGYSQSLRNYLQYRISLGPDAAIKDPSPKSNRGYMCLGAGYNTAYGADVVIPPEWPDAPQRAQ